MNPDNIMPFDEYVNSIRTVIDNGVRILVPGGIGDVYWILVKLEAFCEREGIKEKPTVLVLADDGVWESSRVRAVPFLEMVPFIKVGDPPTVPMYPQEPKSKYLQEVYRRVSIEFYQTVFPGFMGYEYFMCYNGLINTGHWLEKDDDLECNWYLPLKISKSQKKAKADCKAKYGKYAVFYFSMVGDFLTKNMGQFSLDKMAESINSFVDRSGLTPIFVGAWWDLKWPVPKWKDHLPILMSKIPGSINLVGKTSLEQVFGIMQGAELVSGFHCGLTNIAIMFKKKTVLLWATGRFPEVTPLAVAPPETRMNTYVPLMTKDLTVDTYLETMMEML